MVFFVFINVVIYIIICGLLIQQKPDDLIDNLIRNSNTIDYTPTHLLTIILASLMYFGLGSASFPFANPLIKDQEINIYKTIFKIFEEVLPKPSTDAIDKKVEEYIEKPDMSLVKIAENLRDRGKSRNWDLIDQKWQEIDAELVIKEIEYLYSLESESIRM